MKNKSLDHLVEGIRNMLPSRNGADLYGVKAAAASKALGINHISKLRFPEHHILSS